MNNRAGLNLSNYLFVLAFPCCYFYYLLVSQDVIPLFLGGYYSLMLVLILLILVAKKGGELILTSRLNINHLDLYVAFFVVYALFFIAFNFAVGHGNDSVIKDSVGGLIHFVSTFIIFRTLKPSSKRFYHLNLLVVLLIYVSSFMLVKNGTFILNAFQSGSEAASYQFIAMVYLMVFFFLAIHIELMSLRIVFYVLSIMFLFFNGARSEFIGFIAGAFFLESFKAKNKFLFLMLSAIGAVGTYFTLFYVSTLEAFKSNRVIDLFLNLRSSGNARRELAAEGYETISKKPILGDISSYTQGNYIHNYLSVWVDIGLVGFLSFLGLMIFVVAYCVWGVIKKKYTDKVFVLFFIYGFMSVLLLVFAKAYNYLLFAAALGVMAQLISKKDKKFLKGI